MSMEDYKKLVNRLRDEPKDSRKAVLSIYDLCIDAAYAIEILLDKLKYAEGERDAVTRHMIELEQEVCRLKSRLAAYEDTGLEPEQVLELKSFTQGGIHKIEDGWKHVQELLQAEQDGRLVVLPCKAGTLIYIGSRPAIITQFFGYVRERYFHAVFCDENKGIDIPFEELGKTVFLTREEAEASLAQEGGTNEDSCSL